MNGSYLQEVGVRDAPLVGIRIKVVQAWMDSSVHVIPPQRRTFHPGLETIIQQELMKVLQLRSVKAPVLGANVIEHRGVQQRCVQQRQMINLQIHLP